MARATRARTRGALKEKTGAEENVQASAPADDVVRSSKAAVGRGAGVESAAAATSGVDDAAAEARRQELERELADLEAERTCRLHHVHSLGPSSFIQRRTSQPRGAAAPTPHLGFFSQKHGKQKKTTLFVCKRSAIYTATLL